MLHTKSFTWLRATHFRNTMKQNKSDISDVMQNNMKISNTNIRVC